ncbi:MAG: GGDEF domain-containing protein [Nitrospira sp.]|nr:GGDEF domain-containing protein [Nitrospira sp.]
MARSKRKDRPLAVMLLDLDRFKAVNDTLGHDVGDQLLKEVSTRLLDSVREVDTVARMGGDEFTAILEGISGEDDVLVVAKRIVESIGSPGLRSGRILSIGVSIGITLYPSDDDNIDELLRHADKAMYAAKQPRWRAVSFPAPAGLSIRQACVAALTASPAFLPSDIGKRLLRHNQRTSGIGQEHIRAHQLFVRRRRMRIRCHHKSPVLIRDRYYPTTVPLRGGRAGCR